MPVTPSRPRRKLLLGISGAALALTLTLTGCSKGPGGSSDAAAGDPACTKTVDKSKVKLVLGVGSLSSAYWQQVIKGAQAVADSVGVPLKTYESNFDGQTMLNTLTSSLAAGGEGTAIVVDPASNAFTKPIVQAAQQSGAHIVTLWNRPVDAHPWDFGGGCWIAHTSFSGADSGEKNSDALFKALGNGGDIVAIQGVPDDPPNKQRLYGLHQALDKSPNVKLLDTQTGNWAAPASQKIVNTLLAKYPGQLKGIFAANDDMAVGAVEALRAKGQNGKVFVTGSDGSPDMLNLIQSGDALSTMQVDAYGQGAYSAAIAYASVVGDVDASKLTHEQRDFYLNSQLVTKSNVDQAISTITNFDKAKYSYEALKPNLWSDVYAPIDDATWIPDVSR